MKQLFLFWKSTIIIFGKEMEGITHLLESGTFTIDSALRHVAHQISQTLDAFCLPFSPC